MPRLIRDGARPATQDLPDDVKAERFLQEFDERIKAREEAAHLEVRAQQPPPNSRP